MYSGRIYAAALLFALFGLPMQGQFDGNAAARAAYEKGEKARENRRYADAVRSYQKAISLDPDFAQAYDRYIFIRQLEVVNPEVQSGKKASPEQEKIQKAEEEVVTQSLIHEYQRLSRQHPDKPIYLWALGQLYTESEPLRQEEYCQQAVRIDARFVPGYQCLAGIANLRGDNKQEIALRHRVMELEPASADAAFEYSWVLQNDTAAYRDATMQLIRRFPRSPRSAQALYWYAVHQKTDLAQIEYFEQLHKQFPPAKFDWSANGMEMLFAIYDRTDPPKAQALAHEMLRADPKDKDWMKYALYADTMAKAQQEVKEDNPTAALTTLQDEKSPGNLIDMRRREVLYARALDLSGKSSDAYAALSADYARHPTDEVRAALTEYGAKLGKSSREIDAAVWSAMEEGSTPAIPFTLRDFTDGKQVSLASYHGHVVIVDFWFPNCGPCRESFPYLQEIAHKYKGKGLVVLAINDIEGQESFVLPLLKSKGYDFIPLKGNQEWAANVYHVRMFPSTFLIGGDGRLYFRPHIFNDLEERTTELEVEELLAHGRQ